MALAKAKKRVKQLQERDKKRQEKLKVQLEEWFQKFDSNGDGQFQRDELRMLLVFLYPQNEPEEAAIDMLMLKATAVETHTMHLPGDKNGSVGRADLMETVMRYRDHIAEQQYLDGFFEKYDSDGNGSFDPAELLQLLTECGPEGLEVDDGDVEYIMLMCDVNENGLVDREELQPTIARWKHIAADKLEEQKVKKEKQRNVLGVLSDQAGTAGQAGMATAAKFLKRTLHNNGSPSPAGSPEGGSSPIRAPSPTAEVAASGDATDAVQPELSKSNTQSSSSSGVSAESSAGTRRRNGASVEASVGRRKAPEMAKSSSAISALARAPGKVWKSMKALVQTPFFGGSSRVVPAVAVDRK